MNTLNVRTAPATSPKLGEPRPIGIATEAQRKRARWPGIIVALSVLAIAYGQLMWMFLRQQWQKPHYQFFPFVFAAFAWLLWKRFDEGQPTTRPSVIPIWTDRLLQVVAVLLLLFALAIRSPWFAMVSLIALATSTLLTISRDRSVVNLWGIWLLLWLVVPVPLKLDQKLIAKLQFVSSRLSSSVLDALGIDHLMDGNTLWLRSKQLFVDEACSGIISMLSIVACAVIYAVFRNRSLLHVFLLAVGSIAWTTLLNVVRISTIAYVLDTYGLDWSFGTSHEIISLALFLVACLALLCTDQILIGCLGPVTSEWDGEIRFGRYLASAWDWITALGPQSINASDETPVTETAPSPAQPTRRCTAGWFLPSIFAPVAAIQCLLLAYSLVLAPERLPAVQAGLQLESHDLPTSLCGLNKIEFQAIRRRSDSIQGKYSRTYLYRSESGTNYLLSFDFTFPGYWHELTECYVATGWKPLDRRVVSDTPDKQLGRSWQYVESKFAKSGGQYGSLCFSEMDQFGMPFEPEVDWLHEGSAFWKSRNLYLKERQIFQVQVWSEGSTQLNSEQQQKARELLLEARKQFRTLIMAHSDPEIATAPVSSARPATNDGADNG